MPFSREMVNYLLKTESGNQKFTVRAVSEGTRAQSARSCFPNRSPFAIISRSRGQRSIPVVRIRFASSTPRRDSRSGATRAMAAESPGQQIALWAYRLSFRHPTKKEETLSFVAPPPNSGVWKLFADEIAAIE